MSYKCQIHDSSITHICCCSDCLQILCGKCVVEHLQFHKNKNSWPELYTHEELKHFCKSKLESNLQKTNKLISEVQSKQTQEKALQNKINEEFIYLLRKRIMNFVEEYFKSLDAYAVKECDKLSVKIDSKLSDLLLLKEELSKEINKIDNNQKFDNLIKVFQENYETKCSNFNEEFVDLLKEKYFISVNEGNMESFKLRFSDLINEVLIDNVDKREFALLENKNQIFTKSTEKLEKRAPTENKNPEPTPTLMVSNSQIRVQSQEIKQMPSDHKIEMYSNSNIIISNSQIKGPSHEIIQLQSEKKTPDTSRNKIQQENENTPINNEIAVEERKEESDQKTMGNEPPTFCKIGESQFRISKNAHPIEEEKTVSANIKENIRQSLEKEVGKENEMTPNSENMVSSAKNNICFEIKVPDYFECSPEIKYLHFFEEDSKNLYLLDIEKIDEPSSSFEKKELNIDFFIPLKSRSLITPKGLIYLLGGYYNQGLTNTYIYDSFNQSLQPKAKMNCDRENFGVSYLLEQIYVCGGNDEFGNKLNSCERYDYYSNTWTKIASLNQKAAGLYLAKFNDKFIYKFGGESTQTLLSQIIEVYDLKTNKWNLIQAISESNLIPVISRLGASVQINEQNIFIFGGYYAKNDAGTNQSFLLENSEKEKHKYIIKRLNERLLPHCAGFWSNMPIVHKKRVICLQNVPDPENKSVSLQNKRRVLVFDSKEWRKLK